MNDKVKEFAVIQTGGKQYQVSAGDVITIEKLPAGQTDGDSIFFDKVLLWDNGIDTSIGNPYIAGAKVKAKLLGHGRGKKILVVKYKPKSRYLVRRGHRQPFTKVKIVSLS